MAAVAETFGAGLPPELTSFVGRGRELDELGRLLAGRPRLITLTAFGGLGKTRLALELIRRQGAAFDGRVWLAELAPVEQPELLVQTVARAVGLPPSNEAPSIAAIAAAMADRRGLLVLDNCEHLLDGCRGVVDGLLAQTSRLRVLATSREPLKTAGEVVFPVPPLECLLDDAEASELAASAAVQLFCQRAAAFWQLFRTETADLRAIGEICRRVEGIPLAIELAAARVRLLSPAQIVARLEDRLGLLAQPGPVGSSRYTTLRETIDWSYELLSPKARLLWGRLSVFRDGWSLESAEQVAGGESLDRGEVLDLLQELVDGSIVAVEPAGAGTRYRLLETLREYAAGRLDQRAAAELRDRHLDWYAGVLQEVAPSLRGEGQEGWAELMAQEQANLRAALDWAEEAGRTELALRMAAALWRYWWPRGFPAEAELRVNRLLARPEGEPDSLARADCLRVAGVMARERGQYDRARELHEMALAAAERRLAGDASQEALELSAMLRVTLGLDWAFEGLADRALPLLRSALEPARRAGPWYEGHALSNLAWFHGTQGGYPAAQDCAARSVAIFELLGDRARQAFAYRHLAEAAMHNGDFEAAAAAARQALRTGIRGTARFDVGSLEIVAALTAREGHPLRAVRLFGAVAAMRQQHGIVPALPSQGEPASTAAALPYLESARGALGQRLAASPWAEGQAMTWDEAVAAALQSNGFRTSESGVLTAREREIAALIGRGLSNKDIAAALVISRPTVESHVKHIFKKLRVSSRAAVAAWAAHRLPSDL
jgi:non-specific serine/threonine protein kinase